jgi:N-formylglutamate amidohydrolase
MADPFFWRGPATIVSPILVSVPHSGRHYPAAMTEQCRLSPDQLMVLEDRHSDALASGAETAGHHVISASTARAWIDLNRGEDEIDPAMILTEDRPLLPARPSAKVRGGLGLIPRRIAQGGELWREALLARDVLSRVATVHRPYHRAIEAALTERTVAFGVAVLLDLHTMPPVKVDSGHSAPHLVVGDLFRRSANPRFTDRVVAEAEAAGFRVAINTPYAGGYLLERHAKPHRNVHGLQLEIDRRLYLDASMKELSAGAAAISQLVRRIVDALRDEALDQALPLAAE